MVASTASTKLLEQMVDLLSKPNFFRPNGSNQCVSIDGQFHVTIWNPEGFIAFEFLLGKLNISPHARRRLPVQLVVDLSREQATGIIELLKGQVHVEMFDFAKIRKLVDVFLLVQQLQE